MYRSILLALSLLFFISASKAAVFVVTNNTDSGPGTLREALTLAAANGSAEKDYINFNLPDVSEAGRAIILESELPYCSSNLVIDGSTQNGAKIKMSDAKITINVDWQHYVVPLYESAGLTIIGVDHLEIYGMFISGFLNLQNNFPSSGSIINAAILIHNSKNIIIGAPGKGNIFGGNLYSIYGDQTDYSTHDFPSDVTVQSNFLGYLKDDGNYLIEGTIFIGDNFTFGGDTPEKGNYMLGPLLLGLNNAVVTNNYWGLDKNKQLIKPNNIDTLYPIIEGSPNNALIANNLTSLLLIDLNGATNFKIISNTCISPIGIGIQLTHCENGIIGTNDLALKNTLLAGGIGASNCKNIEVRKNSIRCSTSPFTIFFPETTIPDIKVGVSDDNEFSGTASPNADIYIYNDNTDCDICNPVEFFKQVVSDANGQWKITGDFTGKKLLANATLNKNSSEYTLPAIGYDPNSVISPTCGKNNGSIKIQATKQVLKIEWFDANTNQKVGEGMQVTGLGPGTYYAKGSNNKCSAKTGYISIGDFSPKISDDNITIKHPSCGVGGSITNLYLNGYPQGITYTWRDKAQNIVSDKIDALNLKEGEYTLTVNVGDGCEVKYGPVTLKNTTGPAIDETKKIITPNQCGKLLGSVTNLTITGTGTLHYSWRDDQNQEVATTKDLTGQPGGKYTLHVTDDTQCGEVVSSTFEIKIDGAIILDESAKIIQPATCEFNNGGIKGITATGATIYNWYNSDNQVVSNKPDLDNAAPGSYYLVASNANGCSAQSTTFTIERTPRTIIGNTKVIKNVTCGENNGSITVIFQQQPAPTPKSFRWVNHATGANVATTTAPELKGLDAATYDIYVTEQGGCEYLLASYTVSRDVGLSVIVDNVQVEDDHCQVGTGSIKGINANGATPLTFVWTDDNNKTVGNAPNLENLNSGTYHIQITDGSGCTQGLVYTVYDKSEVVVPPSVTNLDLCSAGNALLVVNNAAGEYSYRLYDNADSATPLNEQQSGRFAVNVTGDRSYYVSKLKGNCESTRAEIKVKVGISTLNIANTFSPNNDGQNDYWKINGIESYPQAVVQIFNRNGQKLFESKGYGTPFSGNYNGKPLPTGTYFYIINLNKNCNLLSGSLTILR